VWRVLGWVLALACLAGVLPGAGTPAPAVRAGGSDGGWTDARIRAAVDLDRRPAGAGPATTRLAAAPAQIRRAIPWTASGGVSRAVGRVFYAVRGRDYSCTGVAVRSANRSTVLTAGHCVNAGPGPYATDWVFVPGYRDGRRPYGTWTATRLAAPAGWVRTGATADDVGYAVVAPRAGRRLTDVVGSVPVAFDAPRGAYVWAVGYPAAAPNAGRRALYCRGTVRPDPYRTGSQGLACTMAQGASGGPWLTTAGAVYAVTSFTYRGMAGVVWAPYLGRTARQLYSTVQGR
jgi:V8-like Glu-specific endopeptidase